MEHHAEQPRRDLALVTVALSLLVAACSAATTPPVEAMDADGVGNEPQGASPDASTAGRDGGADVPPLGSSDGPPVNPTPSGPRDPEIFTRLGIQLGPKGNSPCELAPLKIPDFTTQNEGPTVLKVCGQGCPYTKISAAITAAAAGSTIVIQGGNYNECLTIARNNITLQGRGGRPVIQAPTGCTGGGAVVLNGTGIKLENLEFTGGHIQLNTKVGVEVNVSNVYVHDANAVGITVSAGSTLTIENGYFQHLGYVDSSAGRPHFFSSVWASYDAKSLTIRNSIFVRPNAQAWLIHSRGHTNVIECTVAATLDAPFAEPLFFRGTGALNETIQNNTLQVGPVGPVDLNNPNLITYWTEYRTTVVPGDGLVVRGNIFLWEYLPARMAIDMHATTPVPLVVEKNLFVGTSSIIGKSWTVGADNKMVASREAAGLPPGPVVPYPGTAM